MDILRTGTGYRIGAHFVTQLRDQPELGPSSRRKRSDWAVVDNKGVILHWFGSLADAYRYLTGKTLQKTPKFRLRVFVGSPDGRSDVIMAVTSVTAFCKATGCRRGYVSEVANKAWIAQAMAEPGAIFSRRIGLSGEYTKMPPDPEV